MITHIVTVAVYVEDQALAEQFWTQRIGFETKRKEPMGPNAYWLEVGPKGQFTNLVIYPKSMMKNWAELKPSIVFSCEDFEDTFVKLKVRRRVSGRTAEDAVGHLRAI